MQTFISGVMSIVYGLYYFNPTDKICIANSAEFTPMAYNNTSEINLDRPGASNVTENFYQVIELGFYSNLVAVTLAILWTFVEKHNFSVTNLLLDLGIKITLLTQFLLLCIYRYSHSGQVCSGDYKNYILTKDGAIDSSFDKYFLKSEGNFFYYYSMIIIWVTFIVISLATVGGFCIMLVGASESLTNIEEFVKKMDSVPEMMKK